MLATSEVVLLHMEHQALADIKNLPCVSRLVPYKMSLIIGVFSICIVSLSKFSNIILSLWGALTS